MKIHNLGTKEVTGILLKKLIPDRVIRKEISDHLSEYIILAGNLNNNNWNLNLDSNGKYIRFHVGTLLVLEITKKKLLLACMRQYIEHLNPDCTFRGYLGKKIIENRNIDKIPDYCTAVPNSIGIIFNLSAQSVRTDILSEPVHDFIRKAQATTIVRKLKRVHSSGAIEFLNEFTNLNLQNPDYMLTEK